MKGAKARPRPASSAARAVVPKKSFSQNFLVSESALAAMTRACVPDPEVGRAVVIELGAGTAALTAPLLERAKQVTAVERDRDLVPLLRRKLEVHLESGKLTLLEADAQKLDVAAAFSSVPPGSPRVLCGNLPYAITGRLLRLAIANAGCVDRVVFMVQREVAERLLARPAEREYGALTVFTRAAFDVELLARVRPGAFRPAPRVSSAIVVLRPVRPPRALETPAFRELVKAAFGARRKTLRNAWRRVFANAGMLERAAVDAGVSLEQRGETLDVEAFWRVSAGCTDDRAR